MKPLFSVKRRPRGSQAKRILVVVGKRVAARAVDRNLLKRRMRAAGQTLPRDYNYTIIAHPGAAEAAYEDIVEQVRGQI